MKFFDNRIVNPTGDGPDFQEWMKQEFFKSAETEEKVASEAAPECDGDPRGQCRGQVINNDNEEGVSNDPNKDAQNKEAASEEEVVEAETKTEEVNADANKETVEAGCGKEMGESDDAGKVTEDHTEAGPGNDECPEPKVLINNDPNYQKGESTNMKKKDKKSSSVANFQKVASMDRLNKLSLLASLTTKRDNPYPLDYIEAMVGIKVGNLTEEETSWFVDFWKTQYPEGYAKLMAAKR